MFTGIVSTTGILRERVETGGDCRLVIESGLDSLRRAKPGDSICVSGACLTMLDPGPAGFSADVSQETLSLTTLGRLAVGQRVNLEPALGLEDPLGGHLVTGHVDGLATLLERRPDGRAERFDFEVPDALAKYVARKGSVCLDGVSLTVNAVEHNRFSVCLIPHTLEVTTLGSLRPGDPVNLEVDLVARYVERLLGAEDTGPDDVTGHKRPQASTEGR
ncbi:MAG: riboflavin synthase [Lysobacterales bacterium]|jgi:riboflavin synthase